jgi:hypothetical protein
VHVRRPDLTAKRHLVQGIHAAYSIVLKLMRAPVAEDDEIRLRVELALENCTPAAHQPREFASHDVCPGYVHPPAGSHS